jgi:hypothetical protein
VKGKGMPDGRISVAAEPGKKLGLAQGGEAIGENSGHATILRTVD